MKIRKLLGILLPLLPFLFLLNFVSIYPFIFGLYLSVHRVNVAWTSNWWNFGAKFIGAQNFIEVLTLDYKLTPALEFTFIYVFGSIGLEFLIGLGLAMLANRNIKGLSIIKSLLLIPMMMTPIVVGYMWKMILLPDIGIANYMLSFLGVPAVKWFNVGWLARLVVIFVNVWQYVPFSFMTLLSGLSSLPREPYEAAALDGAGPWQTFRRITIPMLMPIIIIVLTLRTLWIFGTYDVVYVLTMGQPALATLPITYLIFMDSFTLYNLGWGAALGWILLAITFIIAMLFIRYLKRVQ